MIYFQPKIMRENARCMYYVLWPLMFFVKCVLCFLSLSEFKTKVIQTFPNKLAVGLQTDVEMVDDDLLNDFTWI